MSRVIFVHLSDIHFGQEKGEKVHIHNDVKNEVIADAREVVTSLPGGAAHGILVTGDVAFSGKKEQYEEAGRWLDRLSDATGCNRYQIQLIPGNHDVDRDKLSRGARHLLDDIRKGGVEVYETILENEQDRNSLFARFEDYIRFCEGYDCALDPHGRYSTNLRVELAPGKAIRFVRINSSLLCTGDETDEEPELLVGARQFTIRREPGEEAVVLVHHPLHWLKDSGEVARYFESRARVVISGHEHNPKATVVSSEAGSDVLMLAAGATVPFKSDKVFTFCYNVLEFEWDPEEDALAVTVHARAWNPDRTRFEADQTRLGQASPKFVLGSPSFRKTANSDAVKADEETPSAGVVQQPHLDIVPALDDEGVGGLPPEVDGYRELLLRFFRDLTEGERLRILLELGAIDTEEDHAITQSVQRRLLDWLVGNGKIGEVVQMVDSIQSGHEGERN